MTSKINALTGSGGVAIDGDASRIIELQSNGTKGTGGRTRPPRLRAEKAAAGQHAWRRRARRLLPPLFRPSNILLSDAWRRTHVDLLSSQVLGPDFFF